MIDSAFATDIIHYVIMLTPLYSMLTFSYDPRKDKTDKN